MMQFESSNVGKAIAGLRLIGYFLLVMSAFDVVDILYPLQVFNPVWEFDTVGNLVERVAFPMIGFGLVFLGEFRDRTGVENFLLKPLSWLVLGVAIAYWVLVPVCISASWRVHNQTNAQVVSQLSQQRDQAKTAQNNLAKMSDEQLRNFVQRSTVGTLDNFDASAFRKQQLSVMKTTAEQTEVKAQAALSQQSQKLLKKALKWGVGGFVSGGLFVYLWHLSSWARLKKAPRTRSLATVK
ncbi:HpsJ family protein [Myxacorys almedinensis]|uniref:Uncharacterized protein n=1 Tax=Myxacorys almedinensis A TaxID=2690445 RepID=A0A8J7Z664_9CYAN|nr:HpsJ family protein [Myxacorys almedinensis]NDJ16200.1 hypothetical protein [Myxacorys almedinensis A]